MGLELGSNKTKIFLLHAKQKSKSKCLDLNRLRVLIFFLRWRRDIELFPAPHLGLVRDLLGHRQGPATLISRSTFDSGCWSLVEARAESSRNFFFYFKRPVSWILKRKSYWYSYLFHFSLSEQQIKDFFLKKLIHWQEQSVLWLWWTLMEVLRLDSITSPGFHLSSCLRLKWKNSFFCHFQTISISWTEVKQTRKIYESLL